MSPFFGLLCAQENTVGDESLLEGEKETSLGTEFESGLILDNMMTPFGHSFSQYLSTLLVYSQYKLVSNLEIEERPSPRKGTLIEISYFDKLVFAKRYQIQRADAEDSVKEMIGRLLDNLAKTEVQRILISPDLGQSGF